MSKRNQRMYRTIQAERITASASLVTADKATVTANQSFNLIAVLVGLLVAWFQ